VRARNKYFNRPNLDKPLSKEDEDALRNASTADISANSDLGFGAASYLGYGSELQSTFNEAAHKFPLARIKVALERAKVDDMQRACLKVLIDYSEM